MTEITKYDCCESRINQHHSAWCSRWGYFAEGQVAIGVPGWVLGFCSEYGGLEKLWSSKDQYYIREDTGASDRTFENETRLH